MRSRKKEMLGGMRNPLARTWRDRYRRPFIPRPHRVPYVVTPGLDALVLRLQRLRAALKWPRPRD